MADMKSSRTQQGFSIIEILIAVIIIGVLATVLIPTLLDRAAKAKVTACRDELERIAEAERRVGIDVGYYVRLFALDDVAGTDIGSTGNPQPLATSNPADRVDGILDEVVTDSDLYRPLYGNLATGDAYPSRLFIDFGTHKFLETAAQNSILGQLSTETNYAGNWRGPYYSIRRDVDTRPRPFRPPGDYLSSGRYSPIHLYDIPDDPWGADYLLFMPDGIVAEPHGDIYPNASGQQWTLDGVQYNTVVFDRPTILSLGPNGIPGNGTAAPSGEQGLGRGDDVFLSFEY